MSISSSLLSGLTDTSALSQLFNTQSSSGTAGVSSLLSGGSTVSDSTSVSDPGKLFAELKELSQSNPTEFKKITAEIAQQLQSAAKSSTDPTESSLLSEMASNFTTASESGKFSDLFPKQSAQSGTSQAYGNGTATPAKDDTVSQIFSNALAQIQSDLSSTGNTTALSTGTNS